MSARVLLITNNGASLLLTRALSEKWKSATPLERQDFLFEWECLGEVGDDGAIIVGRQGKTLSHRAWKGCAECKGEGVFLRGEIAVECFCPGRPRRGAAQAGQ